MADRRNAADGETGRLAHEVGVRAGDRLADRRRDLRLIDAIDAGRDDENRAVAAGARNTSDLPICATVQPIAAAASAAVRVVASNSMTRCLSPSAAWTLSAEGAVAGFMGMADRR